MPDEVQHGTEDTESGVSSELKALRDYVETRFEAFHGWMERLTTAVENLSKNNARIVAVETKAELHQQANDRRLELLEDEQKRVGRIVTKLVLIVSIVSGLSGIVVTWLLNNVAGWAIDTLVQGTQ